MPKQAHPGAEIQTLGRAWLGVKGWRSPTENLREVLVLLRGGNLEPARKSPSGTWWTSTMWNLPVEIGSMGFWENLFMEQKDLTAGIPPQNWPGGNARGQVAECWMLQLPCTAGAGHWESWVGGRSWTLRSRALQESVEWVDGNQEAESSPLAISLQHFLLTKLKSSQLAGGEYFKDLDAFSQSR